MQYVILYVSHNIPFIVQWDPKVFSVVMARKTTALSERHATSNASVVLQEGFFQVVDWKTNRNANTRSGSKSEIF